ncbi:putative surface protein with fasciclin (FAS1) repeats [Bacteroides reticulotermitis]|nr:DUF5108 domain-containing protein [Bacteroides reticulotermitis]MBB4044279.1 putative surface protein with fasciclin (FAS1) repeats [Bacteroides reticulotermitis]HJD76542.1 DUF5108 domain-containing protein [Bacteroides reticulotermitis]
MKNILRGCVVALVALLYACNDPYENTTYQVYNMNPASAYLESRPDDFSEWVKVLKYADLFNAVNQATESFTLFVPNNAAVKAFYEKKHVSTIEELGKDYARDLAKYHIINDSINRDVFIGGGKLESRTLSDDYLTVSFNEDGGEGGGFNSVFMNKEARVTEFATEVSNGYIYVLDAMLSPLVETVYERVNENNKYGIFKEVLDLTGWKDSLNTVYDESKTPGGVVTKTKRNYTTFAVSDGAYQQDGITSVADLVAKLKAGSDYTNVENDLFRYAAYHVIEGNYSLFELQEFEKNATKKMWDTKSGVMEISKESDGEYYINYDSKTLKSQFVEATSDVQAKNGMLHEVTSYMPMWESTTPVEVLFDFCNYPVISSYIAAGKGTAGQAYQTATTSNEYRTNVMSLSCYNVMLGPSGPASTSSWNEVDYFTVKTGNAFKNCKYNDMLVLNLGYLGTISMKTPALIAGKYKVTLYMGYSTSMNFIRTMGSGSNGGEMIFSFDNEDATKIYTKPFTEVSANTLGVYSAVVYEELEFAKTGAHTFKIVINDPTASTNSNFRMQLDYLLFTPIIDESNEDN